MKLTFTLCMISAFIGYMASHYDYVISIILCGLFIGACMVAYVIGKQDGIDEQIEKDSYGHSVG